MRGITNISVPRQHEPGTYASGSQCLRCFYEFFDALDSQHARSQQHHRYILRLGGGVIVTYVHSTPWNHGDIAGIDPEFRSHRLMVVPVFNHHPLTGLIKEESERSPDLPA